MASSSGCQYKFLFQGLSDYNRAFVLLRMRIIISLEYEDASGAPPAFRCHR